jgi:hypothetical protein
MHAGQPPCHESTRSVLCELTLPARAVCLFPLRVSFGRSPHSALKSQGDTIGGRREAPLVMSPSACRGTL